jgi:hypothetical protein
MEQLMSTVSIDRVVQTEAEEPQVFWLSEEEQLLFCSIYMGVFCLLHHFEGQ